MYCIIWIMLCLIVGGCIYVEEKPSLFTIVSGLASIVAIIAKFPTKVQKRADVYRRKCYRQYFERESLDLS